eukprot:1813349-Pleurochrysis_carterae.AAC.2
MYGAIVRADACASLSLASTRFGALAQSPTHPFTHSRTHSLAHSITRSLAHSLNSSRTDFLGLCRYRRPSLPLSPFIRPLSLSPLLSSSLSLSPLPFNGIHSTHAGKLALACSEPQSLFRSDDFPALVYPTMATMGRLSRFLRLARYCSR